MYKQSSQAMTDLQSLTQALKLEFLKRLLLTQCVDLSHYKNRSQPKNFWPKFGWKYPPTSTKFGSRFWVKSSFRSSYVLSLGLPRSNIRKNVGSTPAFPSDVCCKVCWSIPDWLLYLHNGKDHIFSSCDCPGRQEENECYCSTAVGLLRKSGPQTHLCSRSPNCCFHLDEPQISWHSNISTAY